MNPKGYQTTDGQDWAQQADAMLRYETAGHIGSQVINITFLCSQAIPEGESWKSCKKLESHGGKKYISTLCWHSGREPRNNLITATRGVASVIHM